jgi:hypothetical protein
MIIDDLSQLPDIFKNGYRGIMLLHRNKDGGHGNANRNSFKMISSSIEQWRDIVCKFRHLQQTAYPNHRIYCSVNSRSIKKAIHEFKRRQLEFDYGNNQELDEFYRDIENRFFSCLMNPGCRDTSYFLVDCDSPEEYNIARKEISEKNILFDYPTKNGRHLITYPFNPSESTIEIKKDDLILIG